MPVVAEAIRKAWPVSDASLSRLAACLSPRVFPKRHLLVAEGEAGGYAYFIERGMTRSYWIVDGQEITTSFSIDGAIVFSMDELYYGVASEEYVEAVEPINGFAIAVSDLRRLFAEDIDLANWGRVIHQNEYRRLHRSHKERLTLPARERYEEFARQFPEVCLRARLGDIASYLGITPSTLSRIRATR
ncbi:MAG: Crp/Fnr family transcriptional regulator [Alistipes timonensis]|nr:Crp/Fnr family transcriptional regulator [Alistipes timonensis]